MSKGEIILIPFPFTDLSGQKIRPALVLYNEKKGEDCIVSFISSVQSQKLGKFEVLVTPSISNGFKVKSTIKVNKIATLQKKMILGRLGTLELSSLTKVDNLLKDLFAI